MKGGTYPFSAIVGQEQMKLALLLAAVDWRLGVLLRGDKGAGKTTTARALAALLPSPAPFINLPIGATEDRLLGGLHLESTLAGKPMLKPGLLSEAHGGVLYVDEINLLPAHLGDSLLDTAASGVNVVERDGLSASHPAEFVLLGSMNPEEGSLRPQLLDRFALSVDIAASLDPLERSEVLARRMSFDRDLEAFGRDWSRDQEILQMRIATARKSLPHVICSTEILAEISAMVCEHGVRSLRADLAIMRASMSLAALDGDASVESHHLVTVLPLVLAHRSRDRGPQRPPPPPSKADTKPPETASQSQNQESAIEERIFKPKEVEAPALLVTSSDPRKSAVISSTGTANRGAVIGARQADTPIELNLHATLKHALRETGTLKPRSSDLHEQVRASRPGTRYLFVIDSSGSHAAQERMRSVKGAVASLLTRSFRRGDEVAIIIFRGVTAEVLLEPTELLADALRALEYLPTGGRTPLAHALSLAQEFVDPSTLLLLLTDGRANVSINKGDPWQEALEAARQLSCAALVIDTEDASNALGQTGKIADAMRARFLRFQELPAIQDLHIEMTTTTTAMSGSQHGL
ncbi:ATP-binding protein [Granulicella arctica]|uniref:ATP-binding protein n=1 Tax=Granulicella arctica TaxID=940613 RepID=UPI0021E0A47C|nr:ATP-binding protein [Granulicella arctica]